jgi:hypothetical protein
LVDILYFTFIVTDALLAISLKNRVQEPHGTVFPHQLLLTTITHVNLELEKKFSLPYFS